VTSKNKQTAVPGVPARLDGEPARPPCIDDSLDAVALAADLCELTSHSAMPGQGGWKDARYAEFGKRLERVLYAVGKHHPNEHQWFTTLWQQPDAVTTQMLAEAAKRFGVPCRRIADAGLPGVVGGLKAALEALLNMHEAAARVQNAPGSDFMGYPAPEWKK
jgi:hypothetical protein